MSGALGRYGKVMSSTLWLGVLEGRLEGYLRVVWGEEINSQFTNRFIGKDLYPATFGQPKKRVQREKPYSEALQSFPCNSQDNDLTKRKQEGRS